MKKQLGYEGDTINMILDKVEYMAVEEMHVPLRDDGPHDIMYLVDGEVPQWWIEQPLGLVGDKTNIQELLVMVMFDTEKYDLEYDMSESEARRFDEWIYRTVAASRSDMLMMARKSGYGKRKNNITYLLYTYIGGRSNYEYIDSEGITYNLSEPDIEDVMRCKEIAPHTGVEYARLHDVSHVSMWKKYQVGERTYGNSIDIDTEKMHVHMCLKFKKSLEKYFTEELGRTKVSSVKIVIKQ